MITSGLVITLSADPGLASRAISELRGRGELTLGKPDQRWLPAALEVCDVAAGRDLHDWMNALPGVEFVDVVQVNFEDSENSALPASEVSYER